MLAIILNILSKVHGSMKPNSTVELSTKCCFQSQDRLQGMQMTSLPPTAWQQATSHRGRDMLGGLPTNITALYKRYFYLYPR